MSSVASTNFTPGSMRSMRRWTVGTMSGGRKMERVAKLMPVSASPFSRRRAVSILAAQLAQSRPSRINFRVRDASTILDLPFLFKVFLGQTDQPDDVIIV